MACDCKDKKSKNTCLGTSCCLFIFALCIIQFTTMKDVALNRVALKQSAINDQIEKTEVYFEGK